MSKIAKLSRLIEKEKILYLEVEQLRSRLCLDDTSVLFGFFSLFYFITQDIKRLFVKKNKEGSPGEIKNKSIVALIRKKRALLFLEKTPYAWIIFLLRNIKIILMSFRTKSLESEDGVEKSHTKNSFLILGTTSATDFQSRSVQIARKLAEKNRVVYIEGVFDEKKRAGFRVTENSKKFMAIRLTLYKSLHLNYQKPSPRNITSLKQSFNTFLKNFTNFRLYDFKIYVHHPFWSFVLSLKKNAFSFDDAYDFAIVHNALPHIIEARRFLLKKASCITNPNTLKNGVDWEYFKNTSRMIQTCDVGLCWIKKPVLGFIGTLDERVDEVLVGKLATAFPTASIVLVGNTDYRPVIEVAEQYPNIFPVGKQPYKKLPFFLQSFNILITPYRSFPQGTVDHPELPLYLSSGKPIVATYGVVNGPLKRYIYLPTSHIDWVDAVAEALKEKKRNKKKYFRIAAARKLNWNVKPLLNRL